MGDLGRVRTSEIFRGTWGTNGPYGLAIIVLVLHPILRTHPKHLIHSASQAKWVVENMHNNPLQGLPEPL